MLIMLYFVMIIVYLGILDLLVLWICVHYVRFCEIGLR